MLRKRNVQSNTCSKGSDDGDDEQNKPNDYVTYSQFAD